MIDSTQKYVLDTSVLTQANRVYYTFDIAPAFWNFLIETANTGKIISIDRVSDEILKGNDELAEWAKNRFSFAFENTKVEEILFQIKKHLHKEMKEIDKLVKRLVG